MSNKRVVQALMLLSVLYVNPLLAEIELPALISHNMVLQQENAQLWGKANPDEQIQVTLADWSAETQADQQGHWQLKLTGLTASSTSHDLSLRSVQGGKVTDELVLSNVLIGEVWLASGQSNMEWPIEKSAYPEDETNQHVWPELRFFMTTRSTSLTQQTDVIGRWLVVKPDTVGGLSAVAYHFAKQLNRELKQPLGIIQSAWGNTEIEAWMPLEALQSLKSMQATLDNVDKQLNASDSEKREAKALTTAWQSKNFLQDLGNKGLSLGYTKPDYDDTEWKTASIPTTFSKLGFSEDGALWFRRDFQASEALAESIAQLSLGAVDDFDTVYINGIKVGETTHDTAHYWLLPRKYPLPKGILKAGHNSIAVRIFDHYGDGGFTSHADDVFISDKQGKQRVSLSGEWRYKVAQKAEAKQANWATAPKPSYGLDNRNTPSMLYNAMISPLTPYTLKGVIWYQGESNAPRATQYRELFPLLISQWRKAWGYELPFLYVQLANFQRKADLGVEQTWAEIRDVQAMTAKTVANTGMISAVDLGEANNVHPKDKRSVGGRLAQLALGQVYGQAIDYQAPAYVSHTLSEAKPDADAQWHIVLTLEHAKGLYSKHEQITGFEVADSLGVYHPLQVTLNDGKLHAYSALKEKPSSLRYAWRDNPLISLYNQAGLPLSPFKIDSLSH